MTYQKRSLSRGVVSAAAGVLMLVSAALAGAASPAVAADALVCPAPETAKPETSDLLMPNATTEAPIKRADGTLVKAFAGITIDQAVVNDPATGHAFIVYFTPGEYPEPAIVEVDETGLVLSESVLKDGDGGSSLALYRVGTLDDSHNYLSLSLDKNGYVHVAGNTRGYRQMGYWRSAVPHSAGSMLFKSQLPGLAYNANGVFLFATGAERVASYPRFFRPDNGELYLTFKHYESDQGNYYLLHYDADTGIWDNPSGGADTTYGFVDQNVPLLDGYNDQVGPYAQRIVSGPGGWYWLVWAWRGDNRNADTMSQLSVMKTKDFHSWYTAGGKPLPKSIKYSWVAEGTGVPNGLQVGALPKTGAGLVNDQYFLGFNKDGTPILTYFVLDHGKTVIAVQQLGQFGDWFAATPIPTLGVYDVANILSGVSLSIGGSPITVPGSYDVIIRYTCNGVALEAQVGIGGMGTYTKLVRYDYQRIAAAPAAAMTPYPESAGMHVTSRLTIGDPYRAADGSTRVWAVKRDAGPYVADGSKATGPYPLDGSPLTLYSYTPVG